MKTISLRQFRDSIASFTEPVAVVKREGDAIVALGIWMPAAEGALAERIATVQRVADRFGSPRPAPKPGKAR